MLKVFTKHILILLKNIQTKILLDTDLGRFFTDNSSSKPGIWCNLQTKYKSAKDIRNID